MLKTYCAYMAVAGGFLLSLAAGYMEYWFVPVLAYGLIVSGTALLIRFSRWYFRAAAVAAVCAVLSLLYRLSAGTLAVAPYLLMGCAMHVLLCIAMAEQRRRAGLGAAAEYALLALALVHGLGAPLLLALNLQTHAGGGIWDLAQPFDTLLLFVNAAGILFHIGMVFDVFRLQRQALKDMAEAQE